MGKRAWIEIEREGVDDVHWLLQALMLIQVLNKEIICLVEAQMSF
jgi:hypothetical protein